VFSNARLPGAAGPGQHGGAPAGRRDADQRRVRADLVDVERQVHARAEAPFRREHAVAAQPSCASTTAERTVASAAFDTRSSLTKLALDEALRRAGLFPAGGFV